MELGAKRMGKSAWDIADEYTEAFKADLAALNIKMPSVWCKATDHIPEQIQFIEELEAKGFTYATNDGIYFDSQKLDSWLPSKTRYRWIESRTSRAWRSPFCDGLCLWKFSPEGETRQMEWESPWG